MSGWGSFYNVLFMFLVAIGWYCFSSLGVLWFIRGSGGLCYGFIILFTFNRLLSVILLVSSNVISRESFINFLVLIHRLMARNFHERVEKTVSFYQFWPDSDSILQLPFTLMQFLGVLGFDKKPYILQQSYWFFFLVVSLIIFPSEYLKMISHDQLSLLLRLDDAGFLYLLTFSCVTKVYCFLWWSSLVIVFWRGFFAILLYDTIIIAILSLLHGFLLSFLSFTYFIVSFVFVVL